MVQRAFFFAIGNPSGLTTALILVSVQIRMLIRAQLTRVRRWPAETLRSMSISEFRCGRSIGSAQEIFVCGDNRAIRIELNHRLRASVPLLTEDSQIGANLQVCADEENRAD
jgi:hypothetical protein